MASLKDFAHPDLLFPSKYLKAVDLRGKRVPVVIKDIDPRGELQGKNGRTEIKPIVSLVDKEKLWVLNRTNCLAIAKVYGNDAMRWIGKTVVLYSTRIQAGGQEVDAVRIDESATRKYAGKTSPVGNDDSDAPARLPTLSPRAQELLDQINAATDHGELLEFGRIGDELDKREHAMLRKVWEKKSAELAAEELGGPEYDHETGEVQSP